LPALVAKNRKLQQWCKAFGMHAIQRRRKSFTSALSPPRTPIQGAELAVNINPDSGFLHVLVAKHEATGLPFSRT